jgi:GBP family porin
MKMNLNKKLIGLGILLATKGAFAQTVGSTSIEIYGAVDIGVGHSQYALSDDGNYTMGMQTAATKAGALSNAATTGMFNGGIGGSYVGFKGSEDIGNGLRAIFKLETGFNPFDGVISNGLASVANNPSTKQTTINGDSSFAGQLFNREADVGLSSQWGTVTFGRNFSLGYDALVAFDPMGGSYIFSPFGYSGSYAAGGFTEDYRADNSVKYKFGGSNGINFGALYKFGGQAGSTNAQSEYQFTVGYSDGQFAIQGLYSSVRDGISATNSATVGDVNISVADTTAYMLSAAYKWDHLKLSGGFERMDFNNPSNPAQDASISNTLGYPVGTVNVAPFANQKQLRIYFAGLKYEVTPALNATIAYYDIKQNDYTVGGCLSTTATPASTCGGNNKWFSIMGVYSLSKRSQLYAGWMNDALSGGFSSGITNGNTSNNFFGAGIRHAF